MGKTMNELRIYYRRYPVLAALVYSIPVLIFLFNTAYQNVWILYIGNILFCAMIVWAVIHFNHKVKDEASIRSMFMVGLKITFYGLIIAAIICVILYLIKYYYFNLAPSGNAENKLLEKSPAHAGRDTSGELLTTLGMNTIVINLTLGLLTSALVAMTAKKNQKTEKGRTLY